MITEQIISYIKDQLTRGMSRDKIKTNLLAAGWMEEDVKQAFSFAEPRGEPAALKIAPAFAAQDIIPKEVSVDKSDLIKNDEPIMPLLKRDDQKPNYTPARATDEKLMTMPVQSEPAPSILVTRKSTPIVSAVPEIRKPKSSSGLKGMAIFLFIVLLIGNAFLWLFLLPMVEAEQAGKAAALKAEAENQQVMDQISREEVSSNVPIDVVPQNDQTNQMDLLRAPTVAIQTSAAAYFSKYNTYGSTPMALGACGASGTVFVDPAVKTALSSIATASKHIPECSLGTDDTVKKNRMTLYLVYVPMEKGGYCIDSTGAFLTVSKKPIGTSCVSGL